MEHKVIKAALDFLDKRITGATTKIVGAIGKIKFEQADIKIEKTEVDLKPVVEGLKAVKEEVKGIEFPKQEKAPDNGEVLLAILQAIKTNKPEELAEKFDLIDATFKGLKPKETTKFDDTQMKGLMAALTNRGVATSGGMTKEESTELTERLVGFDIPKHDYLALTYVSGGNGDGEIETVTYKTDGAGGTTVAVLTLGYDASDNLTSVTRT